MHLVHDHTFHSLVKQHGHHGPIFGLHMTTIQSLQQLRIYPFHHQSCPQGHFSQAHVGYRGKATVISTEGSSLQKGDYLLSGHP